MRAEIFAENYRSYCSRLAQVDFRDIYALLGGEMRENQLAIPFFDKTFLISGDGIVGEDGKNPDYMTSVILSQYVLLCPLTASHKPEWVAFRDFRKISSFTNITYFKSDTENRIAKKFATTAGELEEMCLRLGGRNLTGYGSYDLMCEIQALPRIALLLLFNGRDEVFPAECSVLFQRHSELHLDPESLAMTGATLAAKLTRS